MSSIWGLPCGHSEARDPETHPLLSLGQSPEDRLGNQWGRDRRRATSSSNLTVDRSTGLCAGNCEVAQAPDRAAKKIKKAFSKQHDAHRPTQDTLRSHFFQTTKADKQLYPGHRRSCAGNKTGTKLFLSQSSGQPLCRDHTGSCSTQRGSVSPQIVHGRGAKYQSEPSNSLPQERNQPSKARR